MDYCNRSKKKKTTNHFYCNTPLTGKFFYYIKKRQIVLITLTMITFYDFKLIYNPVKIGRNVNLGISVSLGYDQIISTRNQRKS